MKFTHTIALAGLVSSHVIHKHHAHKRALVTEYTTVRGARPTDAPNAATPVASSVASQSESTPSSSSSSNTASAALSQSSSSSGATGSSGFVDGEIPCSSFPSNVPGILARPELGMNGFIGVQTDPDAALAKRQDPSTQPQCENGKLCSYACVGGQFKTQFIDQKLDDGETRGGLRCKNGFLYRTNPQYSQLCMPLNDNAVTVEAEGDIDTWACRTDYPGTEDMVIPVPIGGANSSAPLPIQTQNYFMYGSGTTSAQYYVNHNGVSANEGCVWGTAGGTIGNWAPLVVGAGEKDGKIFVSMFRNPLSKGLDGSWGKLGYNLKFVAVDGNWAIPCSFENEQVQGTADGLEGCTISGDANAHGKFVFSPIVAAAA